MTRCRQFRAGFRTREAPVNYDFEARASELERSEPGYEAFSLRTIFEILNVACR